MIASGDSFQYVKVFTMLGAEETDSLMVKNTCYSCRGPDWFPELTLPSSQQIVVPALGSLTATSGGQGDRHTHEHTERETNLHTIKSKINITHW